MTTKSTVGSGTKDAKLNYGPMHLNLDVIVAIDIRVGGHDPYNSDLLEVCAMPLNHSYRPHPVFIPFHLRIRPTFPVDLKTAHLGSTVFAEEYLSSPSDGIHSAELFGHWWRGFRARPDKKMQILCWDWPAKQKWVETWLGGDYEDFISTKYRDLLTVTQFVNDRDDYQEGTVQYPVQEFANILGYSGIELLSRNSLMSNCKAMSDLYRHFLHQR